jgi:alkanesulfonate monooxygenase SsuD/methylene tetrahydromethanopterin reductase-like flavin-dependent oxidoreductase (luciferase family)
MNRIGIAISGGPNPAEIVDLLVLAESLGYESAWSPKGMMATSSHPRGLQIRTSRILLGTSISSVFVRTAPTIAVAASTVADMSGGRFILGLGLSHKAQVGPKLGVGYGKLLTRTRETVAIVRERSTRKASRLLRSNAVPGFSPLSLNSRHFLHRNPLRLKSSGAMLDMP